MRCLKPIWVKYIDKDTEEVKGHEVPCGKCPNCITNYHQQWIYRLYYENQQSAYSCFLTLTYDDEHLPIHNGVPSVNKRDVQLFNKRVRDKLNYVQLDNPLSNEIIEQKNKELRSNGYRYYVASEYGSTTKRPHYHAICFLSWSVIETRDKFADIVEQCWPYGFVRVDSVSVSSISYVTKYVLKEQDVPTGAVQPFTLTSRRPGLGFNYVIDFADWHGDNPEKMYVVMPGGIKYPLPRYFKDKLRYTKETLENFSAQRRVENFIKEEKNNEYYSKYMDKPYLLNKLENIKYKKYIYNKNKEHRKRKEKL